MYFKNPALCRSISWQRDSGTYCLPNHAAVGSAGWRLRADGGRGRGQGRVRVRIGILGKAGRAGLIECQISTEFLCHDSLTFDLATAGWLWLWLWQLLPTSVVIQVVALISSGALIRVGASSNPFGWLLFIVVRISSADLCAFFVLLISSMFLSWVICGKWMGKN